MAHIVGAKMEGSILHLTIDTAQKPTAPRFDPATKKGNQFPLWSSGGFIPVNGTTKKFSLNVIEKG